MVKIKNTKSKISSALKKKAKITKKQRKPIKEKRDLTSNSKVFEHELNLLDKVQSDLFESITLRPDVRDVEAVKLYIDNLYLVLNRAATLIIDVKNQLIKKDILVK
ncbi:MAG: hypothetical protein JW917_06040 [Ignavibacteria bacterium]|nr:hypothetical protein [Ignavibacteria bacterium]